MPKNKIKIKIKPLPSNMKISPEELKQVAGGGLISTGLFSTASTLTVTEEEILPPSPGCCCRPTNIPRRK